MRFSFKIFIALLLINHVFAQEIIRTEFREAPLPFGLTKKIPVQKPRVALVLSGGGARGTAQVGVLKALIENNIIPDLIVGTSFGSIVGGLFASGYTVDQLDSIITKTNWDEIISVTTEKRRTNLFVDQKITEDRSILALELDGLNIVIPTSISRGQNLVNFLNQLIIQAPIHQKKNFDELLIPFRAVCTDLFTGKPVVLSDGDLGEAMRASSSVSFLLSPIERDSFLLADGGLVANIPVRIAKQLGADIVIAVNTTSPLRGEEELKFPWYLADQVVSIPLKTIEELDKREADFVITPQINHLATNFSGLDSLIEIGYQEAKNYIALIKSKIENFYSNSLEASSFEIENLNYSASGNTQIDVAILRLLNQNKPKSSNLLKEFYELCDKDFIPIEMVLTKNNNKYDYKVNWKEKPIIREVYLNNFAILKQLGLTDEIVRLKGKKLNEQHVVDEVLNILRKLRELNYSLISVDKIDFDQRNGVLSIYFTSGELDSIIVIGNRKTKLEIIEREIQVDKNRVFDINDLRKSLVNLEATDLFDNVFAFYRQDSGRENLIFKVNERNTGLARFGLRSDNERNVQIGIDIRDENFNGTGTEIGGHFFGGLRNQYLGFEHRSNRIFDTYLNYKIKLFYSSINHYFYGDSPDNLETRWKRIQIGSYNVNRLGTSLSIGSQVEKLGTVFIEGKYELARFIPDKIPGEQKNDYVLTSIKLSSLFDSRDKIPFPTDGIFMNVYFQTYLKAFGSNLSFSRIFFEYESNKTYLTRHKIMLRTVFGFGDETMPLFEQFMLGGQSNFFGLREDDFLGKQIFITSLEYQFHLPFKIFFETYFKLRYDLGSAWANSSSIKFNELRHGAGLTLAFDTPLGPTEFSVGRSFFIRNDLLKKPLSFGPYNFYFSIGYPLI